MPTLLSNILTCCENDYDRSEHIEYSMLKRDVFNGNRAYKTAYIIYIIYIYEKAYMNDGY